MTKEQAEEGIMKTQKAVEETLHIISAMKPSRNFFNNQTFREEMLVRQARIETLQWVLNPEIGEFSPLSLEFSEAVSDEIEWGSYDSERY